MGPALEELSKTEEHYRLIYDNTPVMMHSINRDGRLVGVNDYWLRTLGYERDQVLGRHVGEFLAPASRSFFESVANPDLLKAGGLKDISLRMVKRNEEVIDVLLNSILKGDGTGRVEYSLAFVVDVTERKRGDAALRESEGRLASIVESAMDAIVTFGEDRTIRRRRWNPV